MNPSIEQFMSTVIEARLAGVHTSIPAKVVRYDAQKQQADVQPVLKRKYSDGVLVELPVINNVMVRHPRAGKTIIHLPIKEGHYVWLDFSERSLDRWAEQGGMVDPGDPRKFDLSDAVAYPGGYPFSDSLPIGDEDAIEIQNDTLQIRIGADGKISIKADEILLGDHSLSMHAAIAEAVKAHMDKVEQAIQTLITDLSIQIVGHTHIITAPAAPSGPGVPSAPPTQFIADVSDMISTKVKVE